VIYKSFYLNRRNTVCTELAVFLAESVQK